MDRTDTAITTYMVRSAQRPSEAANLILRMLRMTILR